MSGNLAPAPCGSSWTHCRKPPPQIDYLRRHKRCLGVRWPSALARGRRRVATRHSDYLCVRCNFGKKSFFPRKPDKETHSVHTKLPTEIKECRSVPGFLRIGGDIPRWDVSTKKWERIFRSSICCSAQKYHNRRRTCQVSLRFPLCSRGAKYACPATVRCTCRSADHCANAAEYPHLTSHS